MVTAGRPGFIPSNMDDAAPRPSTDSKDRSERLESWKEIAAYLGRGVTTVQRWEQHEGLPVHRLSHAKKGSVFAVRSELDGWLTEREHLGPVRAGAVVETPPANLLGDPELGRRTRRGRRLPYVVGAVAAVTVGALVLTRDAHRTTARTIVAADRSVVPRPLANDPAAERCPSLSPDGSQVVYKWNREGEPGLYVKPVGGGPARRLATGAAGDIVDCGYAKWSPAGDLIAFLARGDAETKNIWIISPSGDRPRRLTSESGIGLCWAPDGQSLGFVDRNSAGEPFSIFSIGVRGGRRTRLTTPPLSAFGDTDCAFSPDGRRLAIVRYPNRSQSDLFVARVDEPDREGLERLTTGFIGVEGIVWSPDGQVIVVGSHQGLWRMSATGPGQPTRFAALEGGARYPTFSRPSLRGSAPRLAYESQVLDVNIWRWDARNRQAGKLAATTSWEDYPAVAPNGDRVAFVSNRTGFNEIWTANADGSDAEQVTFHRGPVVLAPTWSPDGKRLAFSSQVGGNRDVYVIRADGSQSARITTGPSEEGSPSWSRDGRWLYFRSDEAGIGQIWRIPLSGGPSVRVTTGEALEGFESRDGTRFYFVRSADVPGLWSVAVEGGKETLVLPDVREGWWAITDNGIYYLVRAVAGSPAATTLKFLDFASSTVSTVPGPPTLPSVGRGFAMPRDGRFMLWTQVDNTATDLMLIDPWTP
jgi:Tol biopolymer transport system component